MNNQRVYIASKISHYRVIKFGDTKPTIQGYFTGAEEIKKYLIKRAINDDVGTFRLEREHNGEWLFIQNFAI